MAFAAAMIVACAEKNAELETLKDAPVFDAVTESFGDTKTSLDGNNRVVWTKEDEIAIFQGFSIADEYHVTESSADTGTASFTLASDNSNKNNKKIKINQIKIIKKINKRKIVVPEAKNNKQKKAITVITPARETKENSKNLKKIKKKNQEEKKEKTNNRIRIILKIKKKTTINNRLLRKLKMKIMRKNNHLHRQQKLLLLLRLILRKKQMRKQPLKEDTPKMIKVSLMKKRKPEKWHIAIFPKMQAVY